MLANSKFDALTFGRTAREIAVLCDQHSVPCGAPEDLAVFLRALDENKHLAMEFWSLVARTTERNPRATTDPSVLLTAIVEAVTAQPLAEFESAGSAQRLLVKRTASILAGEDIHAPIASGPVAAARDITFPSPEARPEPATATASLPHRRQQLRLVLDPDPSSAIKSNNDPEPNAAPFAIPLSAYADAGPDRRTLPRVLIGILVLAVIAGGWFVLRHNPSSWHRTDNAVAQTPANSEPQPQPATPQPQTPPALAAQAQAPIVPLPIKPAQPQHSAAALPPKPVAASLPATSPPKNRDTESDSPGNPQVVVPEELMRQNLISSRVPVAVAAHGIVVLQAVITSRGAVQHLRAIQGDPALRRAAIDAAATWRYRPYLLNGTPVDVSTTISVDFSGND